MDTNLDPAARDEPPAVATLRAIGVAMRVPIFNRAVRGAVELQEADVRLQTLAIQCGVRDRAMAEVPRRETVLKGRLAALQSVYDDIAAGRMR